MTIGAAVEPRLIVMGPSGCGKTMLARALAESLHARYVEGDELHPAGNLEKMQAGIALDDADRAPWLDAVGRALSVESGQAVVAACSALKRQYRNRLCTAVGPLVFILPTVPREVLAQRLVARTGHYMPASLLDSQLADLEPLADDEPGFPVDGVASVESLVRTIRSRLGV